MVPTPQRSSAAAGWLQLSGSSPIWSPDGAHFASRYDSGVVVYDASGGEGSEAPALSWPSWLDNSYLVGISKIDGWRQVVVFDIETGESVVIRPPHEVDYAVGNGQGAVALSWHRDDDWPDTHYNYVVWQDDDFTHPRDGFAQAWSPDGSTLALYHQYAPIREPNGWVSLVAWPNLDELYSDGPPSAAGDILFDPTSRHVAYDTQLAESAAGPFVARLVNLDARSNIDLPRDITGGAMWLTDGLAIVRDDLSIQVYSPTG